MPCQVNRTSLYTLNGVANTRKIEIRPLCPNCPGGGGDSHIKVTGMLVVSLWGVDCRFWSHLGCLGWKVTIFPYSGIA